MSPHAAVGAAVVLGVGGAMIYIISSSKPQKATGDYDMKQYYEEKRDEKGRKFYTHKGDDGSYGKGR
jgi:hypothetical protein